MRASRGGSYQALGIAFPASFNLRADDALSPKGSGKAHRSRREGRRAPNLIE
jgi:hypothetical protein